MHSPQKINRPENSSIPVIKSEIQKNNQDNTSSNVASIVNNVKNKSNEAPSKIDTPIKFIRQGKKFVFLNSFDKNWAKHFLKQKEKALIEIKLDDKISEENNKNTLEYIDNRKNNNKKKVYSLYKKKSKNIINIKNNIENDNDYNTKINQNENIRNKNTLFSEYSLDKKNKGNKIKKPKNHVLRKSSTCRIKIYDDNMRKRENLFIFSEKRKKLMGIDENIEESSISKDNMDNKNNKKLLGKNYSEKFDETENEIINNSKMDSLKNILEELM